MLLERLQRRARSVGDREIQQRRIAVLRADGHARERMDLVVAVAEDRIRVVMVRVAGGAVVDHEQPALPHEQEAHVNRSGRRRRRHRRREDRVQVEDLVEHAQRRRIEQHHHAGAAGAEQRIGEELRHAQARGGDAAEHALERLDVRHAHVVEPHVLGAGHAIGVRPECAHHARWIALEPSALLQPVHLGGRQQ